MIAAALTVIRSLAAGHWILICAIVAGAGWHYADRHAAVEAESARWQTKIEDATAKAKADHDSQQATISELRASSKPEIDKKFNSITTILAKLEDQAKKPPVVFKSDCVLPPEQVSAYNSIK